MKKCWVLRQLWSLFFKIDGRELELPLKKKKSKSEAAKKWTEIWRSKKDRETILFRGKRGLKKEEEEEEEKEVEEGEETEMEQTRRKREWIRRNDGGGLRW